MTGFSIDMSSPIAPESFTHGLGGPNTGGHQPPDWYIQYGMDLGANPGAEVRAAFDGHITRLNPHVPSSDTSKVYGAQIFIRYRSSATGEDFADDKMGGFYTHITAVPDALRVGTWVARGELLGTVYAIAGTEPHLHFALVEIIGGLPGGQYKGVDLYSHFLNIAESGEELSVTFNQDGSPPTV